MRSRSGASICFILRQKQRKEKPQKGTAAFLAHICYNRCVSFAIFIKEYFIWHYTEAIRGLFEIEKNFLWFGYHLFSLPLMFKTFFYPLYRLNERIQKGMKADLIAQIIVGNIVARITGVLLRSVVIIFGLGFEAMIAILFIPALFIWTLLPLVVVQMFIWGLTFFFLV